MESTLYQTDLPIRAEIGAAQAAAVDHWSAPGTWWTSDERVAIVEMVREARDAEPLPPWTAPSTVDGLIAEDNPLPTAAVDVIWRLTNHVATLTHEWYRSCVPALLGEGHYVEIVGLVAQVNLVDRFADALGLERPPIGPAQTGQPSQHTPDKASVTSHWVPTAPIVDDSWNPTTTTDVPNVRKALSLVPPERIMQWVLIDGHYVKGGALSEDFDHQLDRLQIELIGSRTSAVNECFY